MIPDHLESPRPRPVQTVRLPLFTLVMQHKAHPSAVIAARRAHVSLLQAAELLA